MAFNFDLFQQGLTKQAPALKPKRVELDDSHNYFNDILPMIEYFPHSIIGQPRRIGMTTRMLDYLLNKCLITPNYTVMVLGRTHSMAMEMQKNLEKRKAPFLKALGSETKLGRIKFGNGSMILFKGDSVDGARGHQFHFLYYDNVPKSFDKDRVMPYAGSMKPNGKMVFVASAADYFKLKLGKENRFKIQLTPEDYKARYKYAQGDIRMENELLLLNPKNR